LIFKERVCEKTVFLSSAALSAAEKRDYEHCFAARQQLFLQTSLRLRGSSASPLPRRVAVSAKEA
ncbi:hypothetical protein, partial [Burkholderia ubonensis]|uniref:hypothetical protein n=1 Tax=Burkholderia ubonensis TaxID=101571 RepID=UPI001E322C7C